MPGVDDVYIVTSDKQEPGKSPFTYADKVEMMTKTGVPASHIVKVTNPYKIDEMIRIFGLDPATDRLIYALGEKDADRFKYTKDSPLQLLSQTKKMKPVGKHAYVEVVPTATFNVLGKAIQSASDIRKMYLDGNENDRQQIIADLYGAADPGLKDMFDQRLGVNAPQEGIIYGQEKIFAGDNPVNVMRENRIQKIQENILNLQKKLQLLRESQDYIDERISRKI
jgi:hypothetical protein